MNTWRKVGCCLAFAAGVAFGAMAYEDDYVTITGDESVSTNWVDGRVVYVFTNTASAATVTLKQAMTLEEALVVGGGGAGGWGYVTPTDYQNYGGGAGGGGGGVVLTNLVDVLAAGGELSVSVGAGGLPDEYYDAENCPAPQGGNGQPSTLVFGERTIKAFGGGGGGSYLHRYPGEGEIGSGGGFVVVAHRDYQMAYDGVYYTSAQGNVGGKTCSCNAGGGGGAGQILGVCSEATKGVNGGGEGLAVDITGTAEVYGSGGGSGYAYRTTAGTGANGGTNAGQGKGVSSGKSADAVDGFGGGGGGGRRSDASSGGRGGSGAVILAFRVGDVSADRISVACSKRVPLVNGVAEPTVVVTCGETELTKGSDYEVVCANNTVGSRIATLTVKGLNAYAGQVVHRTFETVAKVIYAAADGTDEKDGSSWANATSVSNALQLVASNAGQEIWLKAGTYVVPTYCPYSSAKVFALRGGFAGTDAMPDAIAASRYSVFDGQHAVNTPFALVSDKNVSSYVLSEFERCWFKDGKQHALSVNTYSGLRLKDCKMTGTQYGGGQSGRGLYAWLGASNSAKATLSLRDCEISGNLLCSNTSSREGGSGCGAQFFAVDTYLENTLFASNGLTAAYSAANYPDSNHSGAIFHATGRMMARGCRFIGNRGTGRFGSGSSQGGGLCYVTGGGSAFENCLWLANSEQCESSLSGNLSGTVYCSGANTVSFTRCTFAYNVCNASLVSGGIHMANGTAYVNGCIFYGNAVRNSSSSGADIYLEASASAVVSNSLFAAEAKEAAGRLGYLASVTPENLELADDVVFGNPQFVTPLATFLSHLKARSGTAAVPTCAGYTTFASDNNDDIYDFDVHLLSPGGYYTNDGTWHEKDTDKTSDAILSSGENLGCYAGTPEESKLAEVAIEFVGDVTVTFPDGTSQPTITFELGGNGGVPYNAEVEIEFGVEGDRRTITIPSVASGAPYAYLAPYAFLTNVAFTARVTATIAGGSESQDALPAVTPNAYPATYGHGGGASIIHVRPGATGLGDGSTWFDAMTDFHAAMNALSAERPELWLAGTNVMSYAPLAVSPTVAVTVRGGFEGTEDSAIARTEGMVSVVDGANEYTPLTVANANAMGFERIVFRRGPTRNVKKTGTGDITFSDCRFTESVSASGQEGRGVHLTGGGATVARFARCTFCDNVSTNLAKSGSRFAGRGVGAYFASCGRIELEDVDFLRNGVAIGSSDFRYSQGNDNHGAAIYAVGAPVVARGCRFVANSLPGDTTDESGAVSLSGACGGSAFTNCLFAGNESFVSNSGNDPVFETAAIVVQMGAVEETVEVANCTFAYNLTGGCVTNAADVFVRAGTARIRSSVFIDAYRSSDPTYGMSVVANAAAKLDVAYSIFPRTNSVVWIGHEGESVCGSGVIFGDPLLVTPIGDIVPLVVAGEYARRRFGSGARTTLEAIDAHLRSRNGYLDEKTGEIVRWKGQRSPAIDAGDPDVKCTEPHPNGSRVNMGFYGNTPWATLSKGGTMLFVR